MKIIVCVRRNAPATEEMLAHDAVRRCDLKHGAGSAILDSQVDWQRPDGEPEKFNRSIERVIPEFDVVVLIEQDDNYGNPAIGRGQSKCAEVALAHGRKVFSYRNDGFVPVHGIRLVAAKKWKGAYASVVTGK